MAKLMKFVSRRTWYGGPSCSLYLKNNALDAWGLPQQQSYTKSVKYSIFTNLLSTDM